MEGAPISRFHRMSKEGPYFAQASSTSSQELIDLEKVLDSRVYRRMTTGWQVYLYTIYVSTSRLSGGHALTVGSCRIWAVTSLLTADALLLFDRAKINGRTKKISGMTYVDPIWCQCLLFSSEQTRG